MELGDKNMATIRRRAGTKRYRFVAKDHTTDMNMCPKCVKEGRKAGDTLVELGETPYACEVCAWNKYGLDMLFM